MESREDRTSRPSGTPETPSAPHQGRSEHDPAVTWMLPPTRSSARTPWLRFGPLHGPRPHAHGNPEISQRSGFSLWSSLGPFLPGFTARAARTQVVVSSRVRRFLGDRRSGCGLSRARASSEDGCPHEPRFRARSQVRRQSSAPGERIAHTWPERPRSLRGQDPCRAACFSRPCSAHCALRPPRSFLR